jgi:hypothetical protein
MTVAGDRPDEGTVGAESTATEPPSAEAVDAAASVGVADAAESWPVIDMSPTEEFVHVPAHRVARYRGSRRRGRGYPTGAIFVSALILLVTIVVAVQALTGSDRGKATGGQPFQSPLAGRPSVGVFSPNAPSNSASASVAASPSARRPSSSSSVSSVPAGGSAVTGSQPAGPEASPSASPSPVVPAGAIVGINGRCVEVAGGSGADGARVQLGGCNRGAGQTWSLPADGTVRALGKCLDVRGGSTANRTPVQLFQCNGTGAQQWRQRGDNTWLNPQSGRCLDAENGSSADGTRLIIWDCSGSLNQRWQLA